VRQLQQDEPTPRLDNELRRSRFATFEVQVRGCSSSYWQQENWHELRQLQHQHDDFVAEEQRRGAGLQRLWTLLQAARHQSTSVKEERGHPIQEEEAKERKWNKGAAKAEQGKATSPNCTLKGS